MLKSTVSKINIFLLLIVFTGTSSCYQAALHRWTNNGEVTIAGYVYQTQPAYTVTYYHPYYGPDTYQTAAYWDEFNNGPTMDYHAVQPTTTSYSGVTQYTIDVGYGASARIGAQPISEYPLTYYDNGPISTMLPNSVGIY